MTLNHGDLCRVGALWLKNRFGCGVVLTEPTSLLPEIPDVIGWKYGMSVMLECKTNRSDFLRDKKKPHRIKGAPGMGNFRFYLLLPDVATEDDIPKTWGVLVYEKGKVVQLRGPKGKGGVLSNEHDYYFKSEKQDEVDLLVSHIRKGK